MSEIVVEDSSSDPDEVQEVSDSGEEEEGSRVFVSKKIPTDAEWFSQVSEKEKRYQEKHLIDPENLEEMEIVCTSCFKTITLLEQGSVVRHPELGAPVCKNCKKFYHLGEWTRGEDGSFEYCRWCANGGELLLCDKCSNAFCKKCIKRNLGRKKVSEIEEMEEWRCIVCDPVQIYKQRSVYHSIYMYCKNTTQREEEKKIKKKNLENVEFIQDVYKDGFAVNGILKTYLERAQKNWGKKAESGKVEDVVKTIKKIRTIIKISKHNLSVMEENLLEQVKTKFPDIPDADLEPEKIAIPGEDQTNQSDSGSSRSSRAEASNGKSTEPTPGSSKSAPGKVGSKNPKESLEKKSETSNQKTEASETILSSSEVKSEKSDKPTKSENKKSAIRIRTVQDINENSDRDHENMSPVSITHEEDKGVKPLEKDEDELDESVVEITPEGTEKVTPCGEKSKSERKSCKIEKDSNSEIKDKSSSNVEPKILEKKSKKESKLSPGPSRVRKKTVDDINENSDRDFGNISPISITHEVGEEEEEDTQEKNDEEETEKNIAQEKNKNKKNKKDNKGKTEKDNEDEINPKNKEKEKRESKDAEKEENLKEKKTKNKVPEDSDENCEEDEAVVEITPMQDDEDVPKTKDKSNKQDEKDGSDSEETIKDTSTEHTIVSKDIETPKDKGDSTLGRKTRKGSKDGSNAENSEPVIENADSTPDDIIVEITKEICVKKPKILEGVTTTPASDKHLSDCNLNPEPENQNLDNSDIFAESDTAEPDENLNLSENDTSKPVPDKSNVPKKDKKSNKDKAEIPTLVGKINADKMKKLQARLGGAVETSDEDDDKQKDQKSTKNSEYKSSKNSDHESTKNSDQESTKGSDKEETATNKKTSKKTTDKTDISKDKKKMSSSKRSKVSDKDKKCADKTISLCQFTSSDEDSALRPDKSKNGEKKVEKKAGSLSEPSSDDEKEKYKKLNEEAKAAVLKSSSSEDENTPKVETSTPKKPESKALEDKNEVEAEKGSDNDIEKLNEEAKAVVLQSTSSDNEPLKKIIDQEEGSPRKKLKTKRELDKIRRKSGQTDNLEEDTSDEEDLDGRRSRKRKMEDVSPEQKKKQKVGSNSEDQVEDEKSKLDYDLSDIDIENLRPCRVEISRLNPGVRRELRKYRKVALSENPGLLKVVRPAPGSNIERLCNLKSIHGKHPGKNAKGLKVGSKNERRKKKDGLEDMSSEEEDQGMMENPQSEDENHTTSNRKDENSVAKAAVLASSSDETGAVSDVSTAPVVPEEPRKKTETNGGEKRESKSSSRPGILSMKLSETETSEDEAKYRKKSKPVAKESDSDAQSDVAPSGSKKRKSGRVRKHVIESDDNDSNFEALSDEEEEQEEEEANSDDSEIMPKKKTRRRKASTSSEQSGSESDEKPKKRRRIKHNSGSGSAGSDDENTSKGRHKIRKVIKDKHLTDETKTAAAEERERRQRMEERQAAYNKMFSLPENDKETVDQLVLDFDPDTKEVLVEVHKKLVTKLKPHQVRGVKFMWDACFESIAQIEAGKVPGGAILAHCMGLGKTLQTVTLSHTVLTNDRVGVNRVLVICPVNTVKNWEDEFEKWLKGSMELDVFGMSGEKDNWGRADKLQAWFREGGVLIIGYDMFRNLTNEKNKKFKSKQRNIFNQCLLDPGPDLIVCDEGHLLKNEKSAINQAVNKIKSLRRIILTGTPLQNNLKEYYEMVNFVKPSLLGTRKEFMNRFVNPIVNGQHSDSMDRDIRIMKKRSFILNDLLKGCMQRLDYHVLVPYLQPKLEYVVSINMTDLQSRLYKFYLENYAKAGQVGLDGKLEGGKKGGLFYDVQNLSRIWNHPYILHLSKLRKMDKDQDEDEEEEEGSLKDFIDDGSSDEESVVGSDSDIQEVEETGEEKKRTTRGDKCEDLVGGLGDLPLESSSRGWWNQLLKDEENIEELQFGNKMVLLMDILRECELIGDKVLVFSQSLLSLDLIEDFLAREHENQEKLIRKNEAAPGTIGTWILGKDYYRLDGSTAAETRKVCCKYFNKASSHRMRLYLISTRAGGLGINLVAANRVIIFDASWNPSHDVQSIFRVYRFGQTKPVYIYRFLAKGTMEEKIYDRQVTKQSLAARVVDEQQIERHFTMGELAELYEYIEEPLSAKPTPSVPEDRLLAELVDKHKELIWKFHHHDSLLENKVDENLTEAERKAAWEEYENEKKGLIQTNVGIENITAFGAMLQGMLPRSGDGRVMASPINPMAIQHQLKSMNPELSHEELVMRTRSAIMQLQNLHRTQTPVIMNQNTLGVGQRQGPGYDQSFYQQEMAKAKAMINQQYPGMYRFGFRGASPHAPGAAMAMMPRQITPMFKPNSGPPEEIVIEDDNDSPVVISQRRVVRPPAARGRGGRRGRPRLDPDTDLDFSPEPSSTTAHQALIQQLQAQGMSVKPSSGNES